MLKSYSRGYDMPPRLRNALIGNEEAAKSFNSLSQSAQDKVCAGAASGEDIEELMRLSDSAACESVICSGLSEPDMTLM